MYHRNGHFPQPRRVSFLMAPFLGGGLKVSERPSEGILQRMFAKMRILQKDAKDIEAQVLLRKTGPPFAKCEEHMVGFELEREIKL